MHKKELELNFSSNQEELLSLLLEEIKEPDRNESIMPRKGGEALSLSFSQERLWFIDQMEPGSPLYNIPAAVRMFGTLKVEALEKSLNTIIGRHEILRTTFHEVEGQPQAVVGEAELIQLHGESLENLGLEEREQELEAICRAEAARAFDLTKGPLLRVRLLSLGASDHVLLVTMHHMISDGWSRDVFYSELAQLYSSHVRGEESPLTDLPIQYGDFANWQRRYSQKTDFAGDLAYWRGQLGGALPVMELPADKSRPKKQSHAGAVRRCYWSKELSNSVKQLAQAEGVTLFMLLLASFKVLLHRYTGLEDILVGTPVANRNRPELEGLIGFFVNTLVLRTDLSEDPSFRSLLKRVRNCSFDAFAHKEAPFEKLVEELNPERTMAYNPLFQVMFLVQADPTKKLKLPGLELKPLPVDEGTAKCDVTLFVTELENGLAPAIEYKADIFEEATIDRMLEHYRVLVEGIVANPSLKISELPLLTAKEQHRILVEWNRNQSPYPREKTISQLFEEQVERSETNVALSFGNKRVTYEELNRRANQLARHLIKCGVQPGDLVSVCMERSLGLIVTLIAILKAGGAYVSLDPGCPRERLALMLTDTESRVVLVHAKFKELFSREASDSRIDAAIPRVICMDAIPEEAGREPDTNLPCRINAESLAYVSFTSGSTGKPKGVCIPHRGVVRLVKNCNYVTITSDDRFLQFAPVSFDASTFEIWGPLLNGAHLVMFPPQLGSLAEFGRFIKTHQITILWLTTGLFHQMVDEQLELLRGVKQVFTGGDVLSVPHARRFQEQLRECRFVNFYGPTENTTFTSWYPAEKPVTESYSVPIGKPIANTQCYILDKNLKPVPIGVYGELYTGGDGLAHGYLKDTALTVSKFVRNPFGNESGSRLYKTGDMVRYLPDGNIEFYGRSDFMVKIRGFRIELGEVEAVLAENPGVKECAVIVRNVASGEKQLAAYVVAEQGCAVTVNELRRFAQEKLPAYMVPSSFTLLEKMPLTTSGKLNRKELPGPESKRPDLEKNYVAPRDAVEKQLVEIWEELLGIQSIGVHDRFFDLGGHSMMAVRLFAKIEKAFGKRLPLTILFQTPTVEQLAEALREKPASSSKSLLMAIRDAGTKPPFFIVHGAGGGILWGYANLGVHIDDDQPVYGIESPGMRGLPELSSIEEMASRYVREIRALQPNGPYHLGGYCFGGNVAYEMARQLREEGESVALLALFESMPFHGSYSEVNWMSSNFRRNFLPNLFYWVQDFWNLNPDVRNDLVKRKVRVLGRNIKKKLVGRNGAPVKESFDLEGIVDTSIIPENEKKLWQIHLQAAEDYMPKPYAGRIVLFRTRRQPLLCSFDAAYGWGELAKGGVEVRIISGSHESIFMEPNVKDLACQLQQSLRMAQMSTSQNSSVSSPLAGTLA